MSKGTVFDIRRFSTHDGDGIRTTVFLKGCPMHCVWCQNPEGISPRCTLVHFESRCIKCGYCVKACPQGEISMESQSIYLKGQGCTLCGKCVDVCPANAINRNGRVMDVRSVVEEVMRDSAFHQNGGGVTLSGGEPFFQPEFTTALLERFRSEGVNTAIETSLFTTWENIEKVLPYLDTVFGDCKVFDAAEHKRVTGMDNQIILENIKRLLSSQWKDRVVIRTPLIPTITAQDENIYAISSFLTSIYADVRYELLNYNPLAGAKYKYVDREYCFTGDFPMFTTTEMERFKSVARSGGIGRIVQY